MKKAEFGRKMNLNLKGAENILRGPELWGVKNPRRCLSVENMFMTSKFT